MSDFELLPVSEIPPRQLLDAINAAFLGPAKSMEWFDWKHRNGPWGPSRGWAAIRSGEVVGVRLLVPWEIHDGHRSMSILRAMDGGVLPAARRQGLFSLLARKAMSDVESDSDPAELVYSTSVPASREAYRKLGWGIFEVRHRVDVVRPRRSRLIQHEWPRLPAHEPPRTTTPISTAWTERALRWRTHPLSGHTYDAYSLEEADRPNGVIVRRATSGRWPAMVVCHEWGDPRDLRELVGSTAVRCRTPLVLRTSTGGSSGRIVSRKAGASTVSLWATDPVARDRISVPSAWQFSFADLEGCM